jgi:hypothetical protein
LRDAEQHARQFRHHAEHSEEEAVIRAVVWKELREQGLIGLTLVVLGAGVLVAAAALADPANPDAPVSDVIRHLGLGTLATLMLCVTAGMVCGGAVFAAEREAGTMGFLDALPVSRWHIWRAKLLAGLGLAVVQVAILIVVAALLGLVPSVARARDMGIFSMLAFVWGFFGSTVARTTLGSIGAAIPAATLAFIVILLPIMMFLATFGRTQGMPILRPSAIPLFLIFMFTTPLVLSGWIFTRPDRLRALEQESGNSEKPGRVRGRPQAGTSALVWLALRQMCGPGTVLAAFALLLGVMLLPRETHPVVVWPGLALTAGVLCGVTTFADEQTRGVARFWGEQRLPIGRVWTVKLTLHFVLCLGLLFLVAFPSALRVQFVERMSIREHTTLGAIFRSPLFNELGQQGWKFLLVPAVYGFAAGHLCGFLFRKLVVACGVAAIVGGVFATAWGPSLLAGGVLAWQLWLPPAIALLTARLLIHPWATDRLIYRGPLTRLIAGTGACVLVLAAGIGYRVLQVPDRPDGEADLEYVATLPPLDSNRSGTGFRTAAERHARAVLAIMPEFERTIPPPPSQNRRPSMEERIEQVPLRGWPAGDTELANWLDRVFAPDIDPTTEPWLVTASQAAAQPVGVYEYPQLVGVGGSRDAAMVSAQRMALSLLARGLQRQAAGDSEEFVKLFRIVIALSRTMRNGSIIASFQIGRAIEGSALEALDRWLEAQPPQAAFVQAALAPFPEFGRVMAAGFARPDLLRSAIAILEPLDPTQPFDPTPHLLAERHVIREAMKTPAQWLPHILGLQDKNPETHPPEVEMVTLAWAVPWERERTRRLVGLGFEAGLRSASHLVVGRPGGGLLIRARLPSEWVEVDRALRAQRRAALLKLGLRAYRAEHGHYPPGDQPHPLAVLVEGKYLHRLPPDPFDEAREYGYRLGSPDGDTIRSRTRFPGSRSPRAGDNPELTMLQRGHALVWCLGHVITEASEVPAPGTLPLRQDELTYLVPNGPAP